MSMIPLIEWAAKNKIDPSNARQCAREGRIPAEKVGRDWMIDSEYEWEDKRERKVVTLYKTTITTAYMIGEEGTRYRLTPWGANTRYYEGYDDGGNRYYLPHGYTVGMDYTNQLHIYDPSGLPCELGMGAGERPVLRLPSLPGGTISLEKIID